MKTQKLYASCENCGLAWTENKELPKEWKPIECPRCKKTTKNYDTINHNKNHYFFTLKEVKSLQTN